MLDHAFPLYERWNRIPEGAWMDVGNPLIFGKATINKQDKTHVVNIRFENGATVWTPYLWLFWQRPRDIFDAMTTWPWFDAVREDARYKDLLARAKEMADAK